MKWNSFLIIAVLFLLLGLAGMMRFNTVIGDQQRAIDAQQVETDRVTAELYWMRIAALPPAWCQPLDQLWISSGTGFRTDPMGGVDAEEKLHDGIDLAIPEGTPVKTVLAGEVVENYLPPGVHWGKEYYGHSIYGCMIVIEHEKGLLTRYAHLSETLVHEGQWVETGDIIGKSGSTGKSSGPHLHWQVIVSPLKYFKSR